MIESFLNSLWYWISVISESRISCLHFCDITNLSYILSLIMTKKLYCVSKKSSMIMNTNFEIILNFAMQCKQVQTTANLCKLCQTSTNLWKVTQTNAKWPKALRNQYKPLQTTRNFTIKKCIQDKPDNIITNQIWWYYKKCASVYIGVHKFTKIFSSLHCFVTMHKFAKAGISLHRFA